MEYKPKYPIFIPSKDRSHACQTVKCFIKDGVDFKIVIEPSQYSKYEKEFGKDLLLILPEDNMKLLGSRLWIRKYSKELGFKKHWQFDDNIVCFHKMIKGKKIPINANTAIHIHEYFVDRYVNIGVSGFNYSMFAPTENKMVYTLNCHVYSASLINNEMPFKWRLFYNDDTDLCLQVLHSGYWCTVLFKMFTVHKLRTMTVKGGNTSDLYQNDGRLIMARALQEVWPQYVDVKWRFGRPQHVIKNNWKQFKQQLIRKQDIDWDNLETKKWKFKVTQNGQIKSDLVKEIYNKLAVNQL